MEDTYLYSLPFQDLNYLQSQICYKQKHSTIHVADSVKKGAMRSQTLLVELFIGYWSPESCNFYWL